MCLAALAAAPGDYVSSVETWRQEMETKLKKDEGWLTLAGLFWLKEGTNTFGSDPSNDIVLPAGSIAAHAGSFEFHAGTTHLKPAAGVSFTVNQAPFVGRELKSDESGPADILRHGRLAMMVIKRGKRYAIRAKDKESNYRKEFKGLDWYPVKEEFHVTAKFVPYQPARMVQVPNILNEVEENPSPGYAVFKLAGKECRLVPILEEPDAKQLFYIIKDQTSGKETYPAGRFFYSDMPKDGHVVLDFNKAYSPPCAFTPYATCPLPPKENVLPVKIEAGEKFHGRH